MVVMKAEALEEIGRTGNIYGLQGWKRQRRNAVNMAMMSRTI